MIITPDSFKNLDFTRKQHGAIIINGQEVANTLMCCHCGKHFVPVKGSGIQRGFCTKCMQVTCGSKECMNCLPIEKWLDMQDGG